MPPKLAVATWCSVHVSIWIQPCFNPPPASNVWNLCCNVPEHLQNIHLCYSNCLLADYGFQPTILLATQCCGNDSKSLFCWSLTSLITCLTQVYLHCFFQIPPQQFVSFPYSLLKTIVMTSGEYENDPIFFSTPSVIPYPVATYMLWIFFLMIMPVLLQNLLVCHT